MNQAALRNKIRQTTHQDEHQAVTQLLHSNQISAATRERILQESRELVTQCRADKSSSGILDAFLLEFGLSNAEGVALMCLAEALLRVPDALTADRLIAEKIKAGNWNSLEYKWVNIKEAKSKVFSWTNRKALEKLCEIKSIVS